MNNNKINKIYGTTLYIKKLESELKSFEVYIFQDTITRLYVFAIIFNSLEYLKALSEKQLIHFRIHSSCITSEMIGSVDCDCVQQLNGALDFFVENKNGILFYLIQEGRGCGYIGKARACQITQYNSELTTFDAYKMLGMKDDYRSYHNIWEIINMIGLKERKFRILTNNPDKIRDITHFGVNVVDNIGLHYEPTIYNRKYLISKKEYGHFLNKVNSDIVYSDENETGIFQNLMPFKMYNVINENTYHVASYYLPIQVEHQVHWFQMNLFYDILLNVEYIHLCKEYKAKSGSDVHTLDPKSTENHYLYSENIFERFHKSENKSFFKNIKDIAHHGGSVTLFSKHNFGICETPEITRIYKNTASAISKFLVNMPVSFLLRINRIIQSTNKLDWISTKNSFPTNDNDDNDMHKVFVAPNDSTNTKNENYVVYTSNENGNENETKKRMCLEKIFMKKRNSKIHQYRYNHPLKNDKEYATNHSELYKFYDNNQYNTSTNTNTNECYYVTGLGSSKYHAKYLEQKSRICLENNIRYIDFYDLNFMSENDLQWKVSFASSTDTTIPFSRCTEKYTRNKNVAHHQNDPLNNIAQNHSNDISCATAAIDSNSENQSEKKDENTFFSNLEKETVENIHTDLNIYNRTTLFQDILSKLIIISQGVNPSILSFLKRHKGVMLLIHGDNISHEKRSILDEIGVVCRMQFVADSPDDTLARITGIYSCFLQLDMHLGILDTSNEHNLLQCSKNYTDYIIHPNNTYYFIFCNNECYIEILSNLLQELYSMEIGFVGNYVDFVHGPFQSSLYKFEAKYFIFDEYQNDVAKIKLANLLSREKCDFTIFDQGGICDWIQIFCKWIVASKNNINQTNWRGKHTQSVIYDVENITLIEHQ